MAEEKVKKSPEERAQRKVKKAQKKWANAQTEYTRAQARGDREIEKARARAAKWLKKASARSDRRAAALARAQEQLLVLTREMGSRTIGSLATIPEQPTAIEGGLDVPQEAPATNGLDPLPLDVDVSLVVREQQAVVLSPTTTWLSPENLRQQAEIQALVAHIERLDTQFLALQERFELWIASQEAAQVIEPNQTVPVSKPAGHGELVKAGLQRVQDTITIRPQLSASTILSGTRQGLVVVPIVALIVVGLVRPAILNFLLADWTAGDTIRLALLLAATLLLTFLTQVPQTHR